MGGMVCIGCFREQYEITNWLKMTAEERKQVLQDTVERKTRFENYDK